jgi:hypothetical protein
MQQLGQINREASGFRGKCIKNGGLPDENLVLYTEKMREILKSSAFTSWYVQRKSYTTKVRAAS